MPIGPTWRIRTAHGIYEVAILERSPSAEERESSVWLARELVAAARQGEGNVVEVLENMFAHEDDIYRSTTSRIEELSREFLFATRSGAMIVRDASPPRSPLSPPTEQPLVPDGPSPDEPPAPEPQKVWFEVVVLDEVGAPVSGIGIRFSVGSGGASVSTDGSGKARLDGQELSSGSATLASVPDVFTTLETAWAAERSGDPPAAGGDVVHAPLRDPFSAVGLEAKKPKTIVLVPPLTKVEAEKLTFVGNHGVMKVHDTDWENKGAAHPQPEWTKGGDTRPVSYTKGSTVKVELEVSGAPPQGPKEPVAVTGKGILPAFEFTGDGHARRGNPVQMEGGTLEDKVQLLSGSLTWRAKVKKTGKEHNAGTSAGHKILVTYDTPEDLTGTREAGITEKRMEASVKLVAKPATNDPHEIVTELMGLFDHYTLRPDPAVPAPFKHPTYFNSGPGAWPMADYLSKSGECQAIVRFVRAVIKQVGVPGEADFVIVWSDPDIGAGATAQEATVPPGGGLGSKSKTVSGETWYCSLVDTYPEVDKIYDREELNADYMGFNNFEACLRFKHGGTTLYYGGGAGVYDSADQVLLAFYALAWWSPTTHPNGHRGGKIREVVKRWRNEAGEILP